MQISQGFSLLIVTLAAALLPGLSRRLRIPSPVAEILFGVVLGKSVLDLHMGEYWLPFLAELGFLVLMFQAGMEIDFRLLKGRGLRGMVFQLLLFGATLTLAAFCAGAVNQDAFIALVLSTTSLGLVMPTLREAGEQGTPFGQTVLIAATVADFLTLLGITLVVLWRQSGLSWAFVAPVPLFAGFGLALWAARLWAWWNPERAESLLLGSSMQEQGVRMSLALLFLFVSLSELAHLEPVLGAFMGGCILSFVLRKKESLESKISVLGFGFLIPLFFIHVGMGFDVANILTPERLAFTGKLLVAALLVKLVPSLLFPFFGMRLSEGVRAGALLSSRLSLIIAAAAIGLQEGYLSVETKDSIVLLALVSCLLGPVLFRLLGPRRPGERG
ncbi:cation:proton antiporter [Paucidesulfovibrio longus]|uniref:cation:proton antiporter n=1 Tax=Paucidesulfovibrio longus TaxID=889 RepID=UPI0003B38983|nr:cation:proton antiporter [Paucidesulfovibrio longus]